MTNSNFQIGQQVIRIKGDYVVGRIGNIVAIDAEKNRAQIQWNGETKTWVSFNAIGLTSEWEVIADNSRWKRSARRIIKSDMPKTEKVMYNGKEVEAINFGKL